MKTLIHFVVSAFAILITAYISPGVHIATFTTAFILAIVLAIINTFLRPILIFVTLPLSVLTFGIFALFINGFLVMLATYIVPGFSVDNFWWAFLFGIVLAIVGSFLHTFESTTK